MVRRLVFSFAVVLTWLLTTLSPTAASELELLSVEKIWDGGPHNAFTDLVYFQDKWVCGFREAPAHTGGVKDSRIRVIASADGKSWESVATFEDPRGDIRDAKFGVLPDGRLILLTAIQLFDTSEQKHQSLAWSSSDLQNWEGPHTVGDPDLWAWGITFHEGVGYSIGYRTVEPRLVRLYKTTDGKAFSTHVEDLGVQSSYPNESVIVFGKDGTAYCLLRCSGPAQFGTATPPYTDWSWKVMNAPVGGPEMVQLPDGRFLGGGRLYDGRVRTSLFWIDPATAELTEALTLPSGGDTSYPGFVLKDGVLHLSYYSSHEGKSSIYFAQVKVADESTPTAINIGNRLEPFVDDYLLESLSGEAKLTLHKPVSREVVITHDQPWEGNTSTYHTVFYDGQKYRMYYRGHHVEAHGSGKIKNHPEVVCYAESEDGIHWVKPTLGLFEFEGSKENNIVWASGPGIHNFAPFYDRNPDADANAKYKAIGSHGKGLYVFKSPDAIHWELMHDEPVITDGAFDSLNLAFYDAYRGRYIDFHRHFRNGVRDIKTAVSNDFVTWSAPRWLEYTGAPAEHLYTNSIVAYHRAPHLFIGLPKRFIPDRNPTGHPAKGVSDTVFMTSRDGEHFHRWPEAIVRPGVQATRWINRNNLAAWGMVETKSDIPGAPNELSIYTTEDYYEGDGVKLRRHTWRLDGFVSIQAPFAGGEAITKPLIFAAERAGDKPGAVELRLNVSTSAAGSVKVELLEAGKPIPGLTLAECDTIFGDGIAIPVSWNGKADLSALAGKAISARLVLADADVYAIQFVPLATNE